MTRIIGRITLAVAVLMQSSGLVFARGFGGASFHGGGGGFHAGGFSGYHAGGFSGGGGYRAGGFEGYRAGGFGGYGGGAVGGYRAGGVEGFRAGGVGGVGGYRAGGVEGFRAGGVSGVGGYRAGGVEGFRAGGVSAGGVGGYRAGGVEGFRAGGVGGVGGYRAGGVEGFRAGGVGATHFGNTAIGINNTHIGNYTNFGGRNSVINNTSINVNRVNSFTNVNRGWGGWAGHSPYYGYHQGWVNGYWGGHYSGWGGYGGWGYGGWGYGGGYGGWGWGLGNGLAWGLGVGMGVGIASWALGSSLYNWGYSSYYNPYYIPSTVIVQQPAVVVDQPVVVAGSPYDYAMPINTAAAAPAQTVTDAAISTFDSARAAFKNGDYQSALQLADQALAKLPNDPVLHEFRAQTLIALNQYEAAAASLYAVLSIGPAWDWTTLVGLYPSVDVYTAQLRALEAYTKDHADSAPAHFVLGSQYMTEGFTDAALDQFKKVAALQPKDQLTPKLIRQFTKTSDTTTPAEPTPASVTVIDVNKLTGTWTAKPSPDTTISLTIKGDHKFVWKVTDKGAPREFEGESSLANDVLTLTQSGGATLVGRVSLQGDNQFNFKAVGDGPQDAGLSFER